MANPTSPTGARQRVAAQRQWIWTVVGVTGAWASKTGGEVTSETTDVYDGGRSGAEKLAGPASTANIILGRPFRPDRDTDIGAVFAASVGSARVTLIGQPTDANLVPRGKPRTFANALLVRYADPDHDAASADAGRMEAEFAIENLR